MDQFRLSQVDALRLKSLSGISLCQKSALKHAQHFIHAQNDTRWNTEEKQ